MLAAGLIVSRFLHDVAVLALFGALLFPLYAYRAGAHGWAPSLGGWIRSVCVVAAGVALVSGAGWFAFTAASMSGSLAGATDPSVLLTVVQATDFGPLWLGRLALLAAILTMLWLRSPTALPTWIAPGLAAIALASLAGTGHARAPEGLGGSIHMLTDASHLLAAGVWLGGLWPLGAAIAAAPHAAPDEDAALGAMLMRFSGVGSVAVAVLLASGLVNTWFLVGDIGRLTTTLYGRLLIAKVALFLTMAMLAAANRFWIMPRLGAAGTLLQLRRNVFAEQALGLLVVAIVSVLGTLDPAIEG
jgi:putative copper resistance protein D